MDVLNLVPEPLDRVSSRAMMERTGSAEHMSSAAFTRSPLLGCIPALYFIA